MPVDSDGYEEHSDFGEHFRCELRCGSSIRFHVLLADLLGDHFLDARIEQITLMTLLLFFLLLLAVLAATHVVKNSGK